MRINLPCTYLGNSPLVSQIAFAHSGMTEMTTVKTYDYLNRLTLIYSSNATYGVLDSHKYTYNSANQRTGMTNADNSYWKFNYDNLGQVTAGTERNNHRNYICAADAREFHVRC